MGSLNALVLGTFTLVLAVPAVVVLFVHLRDRSARRRREAQRQRELAECAARAAARDRILLNTIRSRPADPPAMPRSRRDTGATYLLPLAPILLGSSAPDESPEFPSIASNDTPAPWSGDGGASGGGGASGSWDAPASDSGCSIDSSSDSSSSSCDSGGGGGSDL